MIKNFNSKVIRSSVEFCQISGGWVKIGFGCSIVVVNIQILYKYVFVIHCIQYWWKYMLRIKGQYLIYLIQGGSNMTGTICV
jgi:hypothetical protein